MSEDSIQADSGEDGMAERSPEHLSHRKQMDVDRTHWAVIGRLGAVHFWKFNSLSRIGGVEEHRKSPFEYAPDDGPSQPNCWLLSYPCWHDGSSLYSDTVFPILESDGDAGVFLFLEKEYRQRFGDRSNEPTSKDSA